MTTEVNGQTGTDERFKSGFTLIELLVVIVIIAILSALLLTAIAAARRFADRTKASLEIRSLELALNKYYTEYRRWPGGSDWGVYFGGNSPEDTAIPVSLDIARMLQGDDFPSGQNPRRLKFIEFQSLDDTAADPANADPVNPWKKPGETPTADHYYYFKVDENFDNTINGTGDPASPPENAVRRSVRPG